MSALLSTVCMCVWHTIKGHFVGYVLNMTEKQDLYTVGLKMDTETWNNVALKYFQQWSCNV